MATSKTKQPRLTLHNLLGAVSFWGTSVRLLLIAFLAIAVLAAHVIDASGNYEAELRAFIYIIGSFALLDAGYVMIARSMPLKKGADMTVLLLVEAAIGLSYVVPNFAFVPGLSWVARWAILIALFILSVRALLGLLFANTKKR